MREMNKMEGWEAESDLASCLPTLTKLLPLSKIFSAKLRVFTVFLQKFF